MKCRLWISFLEKWGNGKWGSGEVEKWRNAVVEVNKASLIDLKVSMARTDGQDGKE